MVGNDIACDILIRHFRRLGLSIDAANDEGFTALLMAAKHGNITCAQILLGQGKASLKHRDIKYGLSLEEWLAKKGFSLQDIAPIRHDGKGRSRFVKLANIAAICTGPKKSIPQQYGEIDFNLNNFQLNKYEDDEEYLTDGTTSTELSIPRYISRYHDLDLDLNSKHYRIYPYQRPKLKTQGTQTESDPDDVQSGDIPAVENRKNILQCDQMTEITTLSMDTTCILDQRQKKESNKLSPDRKSKGSKTVDKGSDSKTKDPSSPNKRISLPDIDETPMVSRGEVGPSRKGDRKKSLDVLPEKLIANIELGDGRRHSIQLHADSASKKVYWTPVTNDGDSDEAIDKKSLMPRQFDKQRVSISDSEASTNEDGPIFS